VGFASPTTGEEGPVPPERAPDSRTSACAGSQRSPPVPPWSQLWFGWQRPWSVSRS